MQFIYMSKYHLNYGNQHQIMQVFTNLVHNSIAFCDDGTDNICTQVADDFIEISINDAIVGISSEHHEDIFAPFWKADTKSKGLRLDLHI
jgi:signal transduction histidine kinase